jgi:hypothetical protein
VPEPNGSNCDRTGVWPVQSQVITVRSSFWETDHSPIVEIILSGDGLGNSLITMKTKMAKKKKDLTLREHLKSIQSGGGKARWANLTPEERSAQARRIVQARWAKKGAEATLPTPRVSEPSTSTVKKSPRKK